MLESQVTNLEPPNGGFGWIVVLGVLVINIFNKAFLSVFGLLYGPFFSSINVIQSDISLVFNIASFCSSFSAIFTGAVLKFYSYRQVSVFACFLTSIGLILSSFGTSVYQVILSYSILSGIGFGVLSNSTLIVVNTFFTTKKKQAVSYSLTGTGIGQIILPQVIKFLHAFYGVKDSILLMGTLMLNGVAGAFLFQPISKHLKPKVCNEMQSLRSPQAPPKMQINENSTFWTRFVDTMDLGLLKNVHFLVLNFILACGFAVSIDFTLILPFFLQETANLDSNQTAMCLSVLAAFDLFSRLTFHFITDLLDISTKATFVLGIILLGIIKTIMTFLSSYIYILIACSFYGYVRASVIINQILILSEHCAKFYPQRFPGALGLNMLFNGITVMIFGPMFGNFRNYFTDFSYSFYFQDIFMIFVLAFWLLEYFCE